MKELTQGSLVNFNVEVEVEINFHNKETILIPLLCIFCSFHPFFIIPLHLYVFYYSFLLSYLILWSFFVFYDLFVSFLPQLLVVHWFLVLWSCCLSFFSLLSLPLCYWQLLLNQLCLERAGVLLFEQNIPVPFVSWLWLAQLRLNSHCMYCWVSLLCQRITCFIVSIPESVCF